MKLSHLQPAERPRGLNSRLSDNEWREVQTALKRGVAVASIFGEVSDRYKSLRTFRRAIENRLGPITDIRDGG